MMTVSEYISQIVPLLQEEKVVIEAAFNPVSYTKGEHFIKEGAICNRVGYLQSGKLRLYHSEESGNEITCHFATAESFVSSFTSFLTNTPTKENISVIEDALLLEITKSELDKLSEEVPKMQIFRRIIAENLFISMERRIAMLQAYSAQERYEKMLRENPEIILSVPLQYTASFLGITPQHLSRLRKESLK